MWGANWRMFLLVLLIIVQNSLGQQKKFFDEFTSTAVSLNVTILENGKGISDQVAPSGANYYSYDITGQQATLLNVGLVAAVAGQLMLLGSPSVQPTVSNYFAGAKISSTSKGILSSKILIFQQCNARSINLLCQSLIFSILCFYVTYIVCIIFL